MRDRKTTISLIALALLALTVAGCASRGPAAYGSCATLPSDLPADPEPCTTYCRVWVPPTYRNVPKVKQTCPPKVETEAYQTCRLRFQEVCVKPRQVKQCRTADKRCEQAVVQVKPGGYKWKPTGSLDECGQECWSYCYEPPCYQWCNKVTTEKGIEYCTEVPPEYKTVAYREPVTECRQVCQPAQYKVEWHQEVFRPGYWAWKPNKDCTSCDSPVVCPPQPKRERPCRNWMTGVPRSN